MKRKIKYYRLLWLKYDLPAGISVFLVALPLCLGIALASGAPLYAGLLSGIIGGLLVSLLSGSQLAVSGPAAGLTTVVSASILSFGDYRIFLLTVIIAGLFQLSLGLFRLGTIANYFPSSVIKGMLAAIGIILISKQIPLAFGYDKPDFWRNSFVHIISSENIFEKFRSFNRETATSAIILTIVSLTILFLLQSPYAKKLKVLPAPLVVVIVGILLNGIMAKLFAAYSLKHAQLVNIPANIFSSISFPDFSKLFETSLIWKNGIVIGLLASLETLLCIEAIDKLDLHNRITPVNRELIAQGIGNIACGLLGAIPITAVVVRGSANVDAGARSKLSSFTHGLFLLLAIICIPSLLNMIPYATLASILLITGFNLTRPRLYKHMWSLGWKQFLPFVITIFIILISDLLIGVSIGLLISVYFIIQNNFRAEYKISKVMHNETEIYYVKLNTNVTFLNKVNLQKALDEIPAYSELTIDGSECNFIDYDILEIISEFQNKADDREINVSLKGIQKINVNTIH
ncbi:MAG: SulP family inorganic anion transporter [Bacteroidetes bacterium]|nr:SulP family inorganic anion transporter [Bacteroidota bacterium]